MHIYMCICIYEYIYTYIDMMRAATQSGHDCGDIIIEDTNNVSLETKLAGSECSGGHA